MARTAHLRAVVAALVLLSAPGVLAQASFPVQAIASAPSGSCSSSIYQGLVIVVSSGAMWACIGGTWTQVGAGGAPGGSAYEVQYRSGSTTFGGDTTLQFNPTSKELIAQYMNFDVDADGSDDLFIGRASGTDRGVMTAAWSGQIRTICPAADLNGDGTMDGVDTDADGTPDHGGPCDYPAPYVAGFSAYDISFPLYYARLDKSPSTPWMMYIMPGQYYVADSYDWTGEGSIVFVGASPSSVSIKNNPGTFFTCSSNCGNVAVTNLSFSGQNRLVSMGGDYASATRLLLLNTHSLEVTQGPAAGLLRLYGSDVSPGLKVSLVGNSCETGHYCVDVFADNDSDSDGTTNAIIDIQSVGNYWATHGATTPPVYLAGEGLRWWSSGDTYKGDCIALGLAGYDGTGTLPSGVRKEVRISGAVFRVEPDASVTRAVCTTYPGIGPMGIVLGAASLDTNTTTDGTTNDIFVSGSHFYVERYSGETAHAAVLHRGTGTRINLDWNSYDTDNTANFEIVRDTQSGPVWTKGAPRDADATGVFCPTASNTPDSNCDGTEDGLSQYVSKGIDTNGDGTNSALVLNDANDYFTVNPAEDATPEFRIYGSRTVDSNGDAVADMTIQNGILAGTNAGSGQRMAIFPGGYSSDPFDYTAGFAFYGDEYGFGAFHPLESGSGGYAQINLGTSTLPFYDLFLANKITYASAEYSQYGYLYTGGTGDPFMSSNTTWTISADANADNTAHRLVRVGYGVPLKPGMILDMGSDGFLVDPSNDSTASYTVLAGSAEFLVNDAGNEIKLDPDGGGAGQPYLFCTDTDTVADGEVPTFDIADGCLRYETPAGASGYSLGLDSAKTATTPYLYRTSGISEYTVNADPDEEGSADFGFRVVQATPDKAMFMLRKGSWSGKSCAGVDVNYLVFDGVYEVWCYCNGSNWVCGSSKSLSGDDGASLKADESEDSTAAIEVEGMFSNQDTTWSNQFQFDADGDYLADVDLVNDASNNSGIILRNGAGFIQFGTAAKIKVKLCGAPNYYTAFFYDEDDDGTADSDDFCWGVGGYDEDCDCTADSGGGSGDMTKAVYDTDTDSTVDTAEALAANGANCSAGQYPLGVDAAGTAESCTAVPVVYLLSEWHRENIGANATVYMSPNDAATNLFMPLAPAATIVSIACTNSAVITAGTITFTVQNVMTDTDVTVQQTTSTASGAVLTDTTCTSNCAVSAGGRIRIKVVSADTVAPTTTDPNCTLILSVP